MSPLIAGNARQTGPPVWSPDGKRIAYAAYGDPVIYVKPVDGLEEPALLVRSSNVNMGADDWSHDGRFLVFSDQEARTGFDLWLLRLDGSHKPLPLLQTTHNEFGASASSK